MWFHFWDFSRFSVTLLFPSLCCCIFTQLPQTYTKRILSRIYTVQLRRLQRGVTLPLPASVGVMPFPGTAILGLLVHIFHTVRPAVTLLSLGQLYFILVKKTQDGCCPESIQRPPSNGLLPTSCQRIALVYYRSNLDSRFWISGSVWAFLHFAVAYLLKMCGLSAIASTISFSYRPLLIFVAVRSR